MSDIKETKIATIISDELIDSLCEKYGADILLFIDENKVQCKINSNINNGSNTTLTGASELNVYVKASIFKGKNGKEKVYEAKFKDTWEDCSVKDLKNVAIPIVVGASAVNSTKTGEKVNGDQKMELSYKMTMYENSTSQVEIFKGTFFKHWNGITTKDVSQVYEPYQMYQKCIEDLKESMDKTLMKFLK